MIETINYYYGIRINAYNNKDTTYFFWWKYQFFCFALYEYKEDDIKYFIEITKKLKNIKINYHDIILNKFGQVISKFNNKNYILFRITENFSREILIWDMLKLNEKSLLVEFEKNKYSNNWKNLWENKINYFEKQIKEFAKEKENVLNTFSYYIGLGECAIQYISVLEKEYYLTEFDKIIFCHRRIFHPNYSLNYFNPLSIVLDLEIRDYAEYFKAAFFKGVNINDEFKSFLKTKKFSKYSYNMLYARLIFPTYYFDTYEKVLQNNLEQENIIEILKYKNDYELFLKFAYNEITKYSSLIKIDWICNDCL